MGVALMVVPAFAAAWMWARPNLRALRQLLWAASRSLRWVAPGRCW